MPKQFENPEASKTRQPQTPQQRSGSTVQLRKLRGKRQERNRVTIKITPSFQNDGPTSAFLVVCQCHIEDEKAANRASFREAMKYTCNITAAFSSHSTGARKTHP